MGINGSMVAIAKHGCFGVVGAFHQNSARFDARVMDEEIEIAPRSPTERSHSGPALGGVPTARNRLEGVRVCFKLGGGGHE